MIKNIHKIFRHRNSLIVALLLIINSIFILWLYQPGMRTISTVEPAAYSFLYPGQWRLDNVIYKGNGELSFDVVGFKRGDVFEKTDTKGITSSIQTDGLIKNQRVSIELKLEQGDTRFILRRARISKTFVFSYFPAQLYTAQDNSNNPKGVLLLSYNELISNRRQSNPQYWFAPNIRMTNTFDLGISGEAGNKIKFKDLAIAEDIWLEDRQGIPNDKMDDASAFLQAELLDKNISKGWCSNIAASTVAIGKTYGYNLRYIGSGGTEGQGVATGGHAFNELYISSLGTWQLIDLTLNIYKITDQKGNVLNTLEFHDYMKESGNTGSLTFYIFNEGQKGVIQQKWNELDSETQKSLKLYYGKGQQFYYYAKESGLYSDENWLDKFGRHLFSTNRYIYSPNENTVYALSWYSVRKVLLWNNIFLTTISVILVLGSFRIKYGPVLVRLFPALRRYDKVN